MNAGHSVALLSESMKKLILSEPTIKVRYEKGQPLEHIIASKEWAKAWIEGADTTQLEVLTRVVAQFAGIPFELEALLKSVIVRQALLGSELRVAAALLRRSGILFAIRKTWGDPLIYLPVDTVAMWQSLLLPPQGHPLSKEESRKVILSVRTSRLPLSSELLAAWQVLESFPLPCTVKGELNRSGINRMITAMQLAAEDLNGLKLDYPQKDRVPAQAALALDLGFYYGVLIKDKDLIRIEIEGLLSWLKHSPAEADARLHETIVERYGAVDSELHLIACQIDSIPHRGWFREDSFSFSFPYPSEKINLWLTLLEAFGWLDRGSYEGKAVFRKNGQFIAHEGADSSEREKVMVQPDGEVIVPPETKLAVRWALGIIAEKRSEDQLSVYHFTYPASVRAYNLGITLKSVISFLEQHSVGVPAPCLRALQDWFSTFPLSQSSQGELTVFPHLDKAYEPPNGPCEDRPGWISKPATLSSYYAIGAIPSKEELFPGLVSTPVSWLDQPRFYHHSTCKDILSRALQWQVAVLIKREEELFSFIPARLEGQSTQWHVSGFRQLGGEQITLFGKDIKEIKLLLPQLSEEFN